jgi:hypothetical protein
MQMSVSMETIFCDLLQIVTFREFYISDIFPSNQSYTEPCLCRYIIE